MSGTVVFQRCTSQDCTHSNWSDDRRPDVFLRLGTRYREARAPRRQSHKVHQRPLRDALAQNPAQEIPAHPQKLPLFRVAIAFRIDSSSVPATPLPRMHSLRHLRQRRSVRVRALDSQHLPGPAKHASYLDPNPLPAFWFPVRRPPRASRKGLRAQDEPLNVLHSSKPDPSSQVRQARRRPVHAWFALSGKLRAHIYPRCYRSFVATPPVRASPGCV